MYSNTWLNFPRSTQVGKSTARRPRLYGNSIHQKKEIKTPNSPSHAISAAETSTETSYLFAIPINPPSPHPPTDRDVPWFLTEYRKLTITSFSTIGWALKFFLTAVARTSLATLPLPPPPLPAGLRLPTPALSTRFRYGSEAEGTERWYAVR